MHFVNCVRWVFFFRYVNHEGIGIEVRRAVVDVFDSHSNRSCSTELRCTSIECYDQEFDFGFLLSIQSSSAQDVSIVVYVECFTCLVTE